MKEKNKKVKKRKGQRNFTIKAHDKDAYKNDASCAMKRNTTQTLNIPMHIYIIIYAMVRRNMSPHI